MRAVCLLLLSLAAFAQDLDPLAGRVSIGQRVRIVGTAPGLREAVKDLDSASIGGGVVYILPGTYNLTGANLTISGQYPLELVGSGVGTAGGTMLLDATGGWVITIGSADRQNVNQQIAVRNMWIRGVHGAPPTTGGGISIVNTTGRTLLDSLKFDGLATGIDIRAEGSQKTTYGVVINDSQIASNTTGIYVHTTPGSGSVNDVRISGGMVNGNVTGLKIERADAGATVDHHKVSHTYFDDPDTAHVLISLAGAEYCLFSGVTLDSEPGGHAVDLDAATAYNSFIGFMRDGDIFDSGLGNSFINVNGNTRWPGKFGIGVVPTQPLQVKSSGAGMASLIAWTTALGVKIGTVPGDTSGILYLSPSGGNTKLYDGSGAHVLDVYNGETKAASINSNGNSWVPGPFAAGGGSASKAMCWKSDGKTLGYCSTAPDAGGGCTCN